MLVPLVALAGCQAPLPEGDAAPDFVGATGWIGTDPLSLQDLRGDVVLIDFWTYSCVNCIRTLPYLTGWHDTYKDHGLRIIGVHAPEFDFEKERANVVEAMDRFGIEYPVMQDNDFRTWRAYDNHYWPAKYLIDAHGNLRYDHFGEGAYEETQDAIRELLLEAGHGPLPPRFEIEDSQGVRGSDVTRELYVGTWRQSDTLGEPYQPGSSVDHSIPADRSRDTVYLDGTWFHGEEALVAESAAEVVLRFKAGAANFVADGPPGTCIGVHLDGGPITPDDAGPDVDFDDEPCIMIAPTPRSYDFYAGRVEEHEVRFTVPEGFALYTFAFSHYSQM